MVDVAWSAQKPAPSALTAARSEAASSPPVRATLVRVSTTPEALTRASVRDPAVVATIGVPRGSS